MKVFLDAVLLFGWDVMFLSVFGGKALEKIDMNIVVGMNSPPKNS